MRVLPVALLLLLLPCALAAQEDSSPPRISVSGTGSVEVEPDRAVLHVAVESFAADAAAATTENAERMETLLAALRELGLSGDDVQTVSYTVRPEYRRDPPDAPRRDMPVEPAQPPGEPEIVGYRAINMVRVRIDDIDAVGGVIDEAIAAGGNRVAGLGFDLQNPDAARREALIDAVSIARAEAEVIAAALDGSVGAVLEASTSYSRPFGPPTPMAESMARSVEMDAARTPIERGTLEVQADVHLVFRLQEGR